jgi:3-deoxy-alpha-D-manno-octulosonate 8-oxidase
MKHIKNIQTPKILNTGILNIKNVDRYIFKSGSIFHLNDLINIKMKKDRGYVIYFFDIFFKNSELLRKIVKIKKKDMVYFVDSSKEPTTKNINQLKSEIINKVKSIPSIIVGIGGGTTMDTAKAISNLLTNNGKAEDYQGWDLVKKPGVYKIGVPTISGTGAESTRTCVMINNKNGLKLGMNSDYSVFDQLVVDPNLSYSVNRNQYFWTGSDTYIHCIESLNGIYRNQISDTYSSQALKLCREIFKSRDMMNSENRSKLAIASYLGGCAIASSYVGLVHPFSAALSVVLGTHHCLANCIVMRAMEEYYPKEFIEFWGFVKKQKINIPIGLCDNLSQDQYDKLYNSLIIHDKPLTNALGEKYKKILTKKKVKSLFLKM